MKVETYCYDRKDIQAGILHFGVGNFHRAHQAFYIDQLLKEEGQRHWGISGACLLPSDEKIVQHLRAQNLDYTLTIFGRDGQDESRLIGALQELFWAPEDRELLLDKIADKAIKIISLTITEGGYNIDKATKTFILSDEQIQYDLSHPSTPQTVFGFIAEGLRRRRDQGNGPVTILSCDNLQHNGNTAKQAFTSFIQAQDPDLASWLDQNVSFPNSMVDRITPATTAEDVIRLNKLTGISDQVPVYCEDFIQWVMEDNFSAGRPEWENVGVTFSPAVASYEEMKLGLLNASHILLAFPSFLAGYRQVDEVMQDADFVRYIQDFMQLDIQPLLCAPHGIDLADYQQTLLERFANHSVSDQISRLCFDGISKFPVYLMPNLGKILAQQQDPTRVAFLFAAYRHYLKYQIDDLGAKFTIAEPWLTTADELLIAHDEPAEFLNLSAFQSVNLQAYQVFVNAFCTFARRIKSEGVKASLQALLV